MSKTAYPVLCKKDFVRRFLQNEFGNRGPTWQDIDGFLASQYHGPVHIRNRIAGGETYYDIPSKDVEAVWKTLATPDDWYCAAMAPTEKTLFQGEVMRGLWGKELLYTTVAKPMRDALAEQHARVRGIIALALLQHFLCPNSHAWLEHLLEEYPDHVVEFSTYSTNWGTIPGYNTLFWECRLY